MRKRFCLVLSLEIVEAVVLYVHICVTVCGWPNSSNMFRKMMTSLTVTKQPPVSDSAAEAATKFKMLQFTCTGPFRRSREIFEGIFPKINILQHDCVLVVQSDTTHQCRRVK